MLARLKLMVECAGGDRHGGAHDVGYCAIAVAQASVDLGSRHRAQPAPLAALFALVLEENLKILLSKLMACRIDHS